MQSTQTSSRCDVLIVGAGPVGLAMAHELVRRDVRCRIIDKAPAISQETRALGIMPRTLEIFERMALIDAALTRGHRAHGVSAFSSGKPLAHIDFDKELEGPYPFVLMLPQQHTEAILSEHLKQLGGQVEYGVELVHLAQKADGVTAILRGADSQEERVEASWLVGCDGAHSTVRHQLGAKFAGITFEQSFALADIRLDWNLPDDRVLAFLHQGDLIAYFPMRDGRYRVIIAYQPHTAPTGEVTLQEVQRAIDAYGPQGAIASDPSWMARFTINQRKVKDYLQGRVMLAGDAAHVHSPVGAQGMNTGIQDAYNLAWKLALVVKGRSPERLLESYQAEREPVGKQLLRATDLFTRLVLLRRPLTAGVRDRGARLIAATPLTRRRLATAISELAIAYRRSPLSAEVCPEEPQGLTSHLGERERLHAGDRAPDALLQTGESLQMTRLFEQVSRTHFTLLIFKGRGSAHEREQQARAVCSLLSQSFADLVKPVQIAPLEMSQLEDGGHDALSDPGSVLHRRYGVEDGGLVLLRPDGYIGLLSRSLSVEPLSHYLQQHFIVCSS